MKTKILLLSLLVGFSTCIYAQQTQVYESQLPGYKTPFKRNNAGDNWFINLSGGAQVYNLDESYKGVDFANRITFIPAISVGKWFSPYWGVRLKGQGLSVNSYHNDNVNGSFAKQGNDYFNVHIDAMWNLANYWGVYSPAKLFNFTPYVGLGWARRFKPAGDNAPASSGLRYLNSSDALSVNGGIQFGFRLSNRVNLDFDLGMAHFGDYFDGRDQKGENDNIVHAMGGFTFSLGRTTFEAVEPMNYALIEGLNGRINSLRKENEELLKRPASCPECPEAVVPAPIIKNEINYVPNVVFFRLNSSKVDVNQLISVYNTASFIKETGEKIKVIGYADKDTGTSKYNLELSEKRAKAVAKELTTKYNVPSEKIVVEWKGSDEQPYKENNWNRVVIMSAQ